MRNTIIMVVAIATAVLTSCSKTDKENLVGTWGIQNMKSKGELMTSIDTKDHGKIVEKIWKEQGPILTQMGISKAEIKKNVASEAKKLAKVTFVFAENGTVKISANDGKSKPEEAKYTLDEKKKELVIQSDKQPKLTYTYTISDEQLIMKQKQDELTFVRKS